MQVDVDEFYPILKKNEEDSLLNEQVYFSEKRVNEFWLQESKI